MKDKNLMQMAFEQIAIKSRGEHGMLCDFRKDSDGNYMSACERAAFWAWKMVDSLHTYEKNPVPFFDSNKNFDEEPLISDREILERPSIKLPDLTGQFLRGDGLVLELGDKIRTINIDLAAPGSRDETVVYKQENQMFDRLPNRNGRIYRESPNLHFSDLSPEVQEKFTKAVDRLEKNAHRPSISVNPLTTSGDLQKIIKDADALGLNVKLEYPDTIGNNNPHSMSFSVTTMNDIPKQGEKPMFYNIDQLAFLPALKDIPFCEENSKRLDEAFEKLKGKLADNIESPFPSKSLYETTPSQDQRLEAAENVEMNNKSIAEEETPVFKPIHSLY